MSDSESACQFLKGIVETLEEMKETETTEREAETGGDGGDHNLMELTGKSWDRLVHLWKEYGHGEESLEKRKKCVHKYAQELYADMIGEEERRIIEKKAELEKLHSELDVLTEEHELPKAEFEAASLLDEQTVLMGRIDELKKLKVKKMEVWVELRKEESVLCEEMGEEMSIVPPGIPKEQDVNGLRTVISTMQRERTRRTKMYNKLKQSVSGHLEQLEKVPTSPIENTLLGPAKPILSLTFLKEAGQLEAELVSQIRENEESVSCFWIKVKELWKRLEIEENFQNQFETGHPGAKPSVLEALRAEHNRLEALKIANLPSFISRLRRDINLLSAEVFKYTTLPEEAVTEECLDEHEQILEDLKTYSSENHKILDLFRKRNAVWKEWKECETRAEDPNRLNNRGGGLLREEKQRRALEKKLPKIEKEIDDLSNGFTVFGANVTELMKAEWDEHNRDKEDRKAEKKKKTVGGVEKSVMDMTRKRPATPAGATPGKRNKLMPFNKVVANTPRTRAGGLKDHLVSPARTYTDFTNHPQIFQSTLNNGAGPNEHPTPLKTAAKGTPRQAAATKKLFMTPTMHL